MNDAVMVQGRWLTPQDVTRIRELMLANPGWSRRRLSEALCAEWDWRNGAGRLKDMATRALLLKLQARGLIRLPARRFKTVSRMRLERTLPLVWEEEPAIECTLAQLGPLSIREVSCDPSARARFAAALARHHYLGHRGTVGENLQYTVTDRQDRLLGCLLFGSAAWKCRVRDEFIGWTPHQRQQRLHLITNNTRFLISSSVRVPHLASWILGRVLRRLSDDWHSKYGHDILVVETFVERDRFTGTSYKAANWMCLGSTTGRSRQDRHSTLRVPVKDVYLYPLRHTFRQELSS